MSTIPNGYSYFTNSSRSACFSKTYCGPFVIRSQPKISHFSISQPFFVNGRSVGGHENLKKKATHCEIECNAAATVDISSPTALDFQNILADRILSTSSGNLEASTIRIVLVRHGESTWNAEGRIQGSSDWAVLTAKGLSQAETSRQMLINDSFDFCFHSPLQRSAKTAEIIWNGRGQPMIPLTDLREIDLYSFQGLLKAEGKAQFGAAYKMWQTDAANFEIDGHYPVRELWARALSCWDLILGQVGASSSVLVVAHNAVNQAMVAAALGLGPEYFRRLLQSNCGVSVLDLTKNVALQNSRLPAVQVSLNRLNQTPSPPISSSAGRAAQIRLFFICTAATDSLASNSSPTDSAFSDAPLNMLGVVQSRKTAELLLDVSVDLLLRGLSKRDKQTAHAILEVQEAAECLGADCIARYVDETELPELKSVQLADRASPESNGESVELVWSQTMAAWGKILSAASREGAGEGARNIVVVASESVLAGIICHCLELSPEHLWLFHLNASCLSVVDLPDGAGGQGVVRCLNYTSHLGRWSVPVTLPVANDEDF